MLEISRRRLFQLGGATTLAAAGLSLEGALTPASAISPRRRFKLAADSHPLYTTSGEASIGLNTGVHSIAQSFGFDEPGNALYVVQKAVQGGPADGNILISRFSGTNPTSVVSSMKANAAGHGGGLAVEHLPQDNDAYLWIERAADATGRGTGIARVHFTPGATIDLGALTTYDDVAPTYSGWKWPRAFFDHQYQRLTIWYRSTASIPFQIRVLVWEMASIRTAAPEYDIRDLTTVAPIFDRTIECEGSTDGTPIQGVCTYGDFVYVLQGNGNADPITLRSYDLASTAPKLDMRWTYIQIWPRKNAAGDVVRAPREPEGLCIKKGASIDGTDDKLVFGIVFDQGGVDNKYWLAYKDVFL